MTSYSDTMTLTFGDVAENHAGMQKIGKLANEGFSVKDLVEIGKKFEKDGYDVELVDLSPKGFDTKAFCVKYGKVFDKAAVLIVKNGVKALLPVGITATDLREEQAALDHDTKAFMYGRVVNKRARYNLCFSDVGQEPDYMSGKGRIVAFGDVPLTQHMREKLPTYFGKKAEELQLEGNYYYDVKSCGIGFHGDTERRKVIGIRLGAKFPLHYQWFYYGKPIGDRFILEPEHGDFYVMSDKATGYDWKKKSLTTLRHAAGSDKFTTIVSKVKKS